MPQIRFSDHLSFVCLIAFLVILQAISLNMLQNNTTSGVKLTNYTNTISQFMNMSFSYNTSKIPLNQSVTDCTYREQSHTYKMSDVPNLFSYRDYCNENNTHWENYTTPDGYSVIAHNNITVTRGDCTEPHNMDTNYMITTTTSTLILSSIFLATYVVFGIISIYKLSTYLIRNVALTLFTLIVFGIFFTTLLNMGVTGTSYYESSSDQNFSYEKFLLYVSLFNILSMYILCLIVYQLMIHMATMFGGVETTVDVGNTNYGTTSTPKLRLNVN